MANIAGTLVYVFNNRTGNVEALYRADSSNELLAEYEYTPFGETRRQSGELSNKNPLHYSTRYHEGNTGLYYYGFRHYSPVTKKWFSQDPLEEDGGMNMYQFAHNNPVNEIDVLGLCCEVIVAFAHGPSDDNKTRKGTEQERLAENLALNNPDAVIIPFGCNAASVLANIRSKVTFAKDTVMQKAFPEMTNLPNKEIPGSETKDQMDDVFDPGGYAMMRLLDEIRKQKENMCKNGSPSGKKCPSVKARVEGTDTPGGSETLPITTNNVLKVQKTFNSLLDDINKEPCPENK